MNHFFINKIPQRDYLNNALSLPIITLWRINIALFQLKWFFFHNVWLWSVHLSLSRSVCCAKISMRVFKLGWTNFFIRNFFKLYRIFTRKYFLSNRYHRYKLYYSFPLQKIVEYKTSTGIEEKITKQTYFLAQCKLKF